MNILKNSPGIFTFEIFIVSINMFSTDIFSANGFYSAYILKILKKQERISRQFNQIYL